MHRAHWTPARIGEASLCAYHVLRISLSSCLGQRSLVAAGRTKVLLLATHQGGTASHRTPRLLLVCLTRTVVSLPLPLPSPPKSSTCSWCDLGVSDHKILIPHLELVCGLSYAARSSVFAVPDETALRADPHFVLCVRDWRINWFDIREAAEQVPVRRSTHFIAANNAPVRLIFGSSATGWAWRSNNNKPPPPAVAQPERLAGKTNAVARLTSCCLPL